ncbi:MAG: hypothetical protein AAF799_00810 [Myxococcota bacterium]
MVTVGLFGLVPSLALAQPAPAPTPAPSEPEPAPIQTPEQPAPTSSPAPATTTSTPAPAVDDAAWTALQGRQVAVMTNGGTVSGELLRSDGDSVVLVLADGQVRTIPKSQATGVRVVQTPAPTTPAPTTPAPTPAATTSDPQPSPAAAEAEPEAEPEEELTPGQQRRKERRENREHALLGLLAMHGATYSHWRDSGDGTDAYAVNSGHASYAMDWGVGVNLSPTFGMYAIAGGLLGAKIDNDRIKANYGHVAALFAFGGKYYFSTVGAGVGFSRLRFEDDTLHKDTGLALPFKLVGKIPLPKKLYLGIGLTYELAMVRGFSRFINAIGGQITVGRW